MLLLQPIESFNSRCEAKALHKLAALLLFYYKINRIYCSDELMAVREQAATAECHLFRQFHHEAWHRLRPQMDDT